MLIQNKGKSVLRKKNIAKTIEVKLVIIKKKRNFFFLEIEISLQDCIIYKTCKI